MEIYRQEKMDGLEERLANTSSTLACQIVVDSIENSIPRIVAELTDYDVHPLTTVLVTTGWNENDDVFDPAEMWAARKTPEDKQLNINHDDKQIVGHITSSMVVDDNGNEVTSGDNLPAKFHIITGAVLYKYWQTPELQTKMNNLLQEIAEGKWFVSMEALFNNFDYSLKSPDGTTKTVARDATTAHLSKHLRCYGGDGMYEEYKIGRVLRNITFSGKGLVKNPANKESVILGGLVYESVEANNIQESLTVAEETVNTNDALLAEAVEAKKQADELLVQAKASIEDLQTQVAELQGKLQEANDELAKMHEAQRVASRKSKIKEYLGWDEEKADQYVRLTPTQTEQDFASVLEILKISASVAATDPVEEEEADVEHDSEGEESAASTPVEAAEVQPTAALATVAVPDSVNDVAKAIASYLGVSTEEN